jgi:hypothetical protein
MFWFLGFNAIIIYLALQLSLFFFKAGIKNRKETIGKIHISFGIGFLFIGINFTLKLLKHTVLGSFPSFQNILYISASSAAALVIIIIEPTFRRNRFFSIASLIDVGLFITIAPESPYIIIALGWTIFILAFPIIFIYNIYHNTGPKIRMRIILLIISIFIIYLGILLNLEQSAEFIPDEGFVIIGYLLVAIGLLGIYQSFYRINVFNEIDWQKSLEELYIIHKKLLIPIYHQNLKIFPTETKKVSDNNTDMEFFSGGLVGINSLLKDISESKAFGTKGISLIEQQGKFILIEHAEEAIICVIATKNFESLRYYLRKIRDAWETYYCTRPIDWTQIKAENFSAMHMIVNSILAGE